MDNKKQMQDALLEAIEIMIDNKLKNLPFNYYVDGVVKSIRTAEYSDGSAEELCDVVINDKMYSDIPISGGSYVRVGDIVQILIKNGDWNKKIINGISRPYKTYKGGRVII